MSPISEIVCRQPSETSVSHHKLDNKHNESASNTNQTTQQYKKQQITDVASQPSPPKEFQLQSSRTATEQFREKIVNEQVLFLDDPNNCPADIQESRLHIITTPDGDSSIFPFASTTPHIEERLMRYEQTNELCLPLSSAVVLKRKQEMLYVHMDLKNNLTTDALVDSRAYVSKIAQELATIKQKAPNNFFKINDPPNFQKQIANGQLEKPLATTTLKFDFGDNTFAEHFVVLKKTYALVAFG